MNSSLFSIGVLLPFQLRAWGCDETTVKSPISPFQVLIIQGGRSRVWCLMFRFHAALCSGQWEGRVELGLSLLHHCVAPHIVLGICGCDRLSTLLSHCVAFFSCLNGCLRCENWNPWHYERKDKVTQNVV
jgi:hypothetical protein